MNNTTLLRINKSSIQSWQLAMEYNIDVSLCFSIISVANYGTKFAPKAESSGAWASISGGLKGGWDNTVFAFKHPIISYNVWIGIISYSYMTIFKWNILQLLQNFVHAIGFTSVTDDWVGRKKIRPTPAGGVSFPWITYFDLLGFTISLFNLFLLHLLSACIDLENFRNVRGRILSRELYYLCHLQIIKKCVLLSKVNMCAILMYTIVIRLTGPSFLTRQNVRRW